LRAGVLGINRFEAQAASVGPAAARPGGRGYGSWCPVNCAIEL
jgi:hypothetical protein